MVLGLILGPMLEENFRRALIISSGDYGIFVARPITLVMLSAVVVYLGLPVIMWAWKHRRGAARAAQLPPGDQRDGG